MIFLYDNLTDDYTITAKSCETGYSIINLQDSQLAKTWRSTNTSSEWVMLDLGATTISVNHIAIAEHNFSTKATIEFEASSSSGFSSPVLTTTLTHSTGIIMQAITATTKRFVRYMVDDSTNNDGYIEYGRIFIGERLTTTDGAGIDISLKLNDSSIVKKSITGQIIADVGIVTKTLDNVAYPIISNTVKEQIEVMFNDVKTAESIFLLMYSGETTDFEPLYCNFAETPTFEHLEDLKWSMNAISFEEAR